MDCIEGMKLMANGSVDAVIADLPYGVLNRSNKAAHWDRQIPLEALWKQYRRITKPGSPVILFAQGIFSAQLMLSQPRMWRYNLVWRKDRVTGHLNANRMPLRQHEDIIVFYDRQPVVLHQGIFLLYRVVRCALRNLLRIQSSLSYLYISSPARRSGSPFLFRIRIR